MMAGGIGIAPFRSMIRDTLDAGRPPAIDLIYVNRTVDFPFEAELREWERKVPSFAIHTLQTGNGERLDHRRVGRLITHPEAARPAYYIVGPPTMVDRTGELLIGLGIAGDRIMTDRFEGY